MHWRVRALLEDRPGELAALARQCGEENVNILALQIFPTEQNGVVDELVLHSPSGWTERDVENLLLRAGTPSHAVAACTPHALEDPTVGYLRAAQAVVADPQQLPQRLGQLLEASVQPGTADRDELTLEDGEGPAVRLYRRAPFTATEQARTRELRRIAAGAHRGSTAAAASIPDPAAARLRRGRGGDTDAVVAMHGRCSPDTIRRRYHAPMPYLSHRAARSQVAPERGWSVVAVCGEDLVGTATAGRDHDGEYEVGLLVEDRWQRLGLGTRLLNALALQAAEQGTTRLTCIFQPDNAPVLATLRRAGLHARVRQVDGLLHAAIYLTTLQRAATAGDGRLRHVREAPDEVCSLVNMTGNEEQSTA